MKIGRRPLAVFAASAVAAAFLIVQGTASADSSQGTSPEQTASVVRAASGDQVGAVSRLTEAGGRLSADLSNGEVSIGADADSPVVISPGDDKAVLLDLPNVSTGEAVQTSDGTVVRPGPDASTSVQALTNGHIRAAVTLHNADAPKAYPFSFTLPEGAALRPGAANPL